MQKHHPRRSIDSYSYGALLSIRSIVHRDEEHSIRRGPPAHPLPRVGALSVSGATIAIALSPSLSYMGPGIALE